MNAALTEAFNHITSGTRPRALRGTGSSFVLKEVEGQEDRQENSQENKKKRKEWRSFPGCLVVVLREFTDAAASAKTACKGPSVSRSKMHIF